MHYKLLLVFSLAMGVATLRLCLPDKGQLRYHKCKTCFRSNLPSISWKNFNSVKECAKFANSKNGLAFNFSPPELKNLTQNRYFRNCQVLGCPEIQNSSTLIFDPAFDYYSAYSLNSTTNATCIKSLGLFDVIHQKKNYVDAINHCLSLGGDLADIMNEFRTNSLADLLKTMNNWYKGAYVGLSDMENEGTFVNPIGNLLQCSQFRAWAPGHPRPNRKREDCVVLDSERTWRAINCKIPLSFICEFRSSTPLDQTTGIKKGDCSKISNKKQKRRCLVNNGLFELYNTSKRIDQCALLNDID